MKNRFKIAFATVLLSLVIAGCPGTQFSPPEGKEKVIADLKARRAAFNPVEIDFKFKFPKGVFFTASLEGHAVYELTENGPLLRLVAFGPLGAQALDLLVADGEFLVKLPERSEPLCQEDLCREYGDSPLTRLPSVLAARPGLFIGGVPEGISNDWSFRRTPRGAWLTSPDGASYLVAGVPPVIQKAVIEEGTIGTLVVHMDDWRFAPGGPYPKNAVTKFDNRALFSLTVRNWQSTPSLPPDLFDMKAETTTSIRNLLK